MEPIRCPKLPSHYAGTSLLSYSTQWKAHQRSSSSGGGSAANNNATSAASTVFGLAFFSETSSNHWLFGCTADGEVCVWKLGDPPNAPDVDEDDDDVEEAAILDHPLYSSSKVIAPTSSRPVVRLKISKGVLYNCKTVERLDGTWLVVSGDDGVLILDWETEILPKIQKQQKKHSNETCLQQHTIRRHFKSYPSALEACVEVNDVVVQGNYMYGAVGDAFGCYKWDLETEKVVTTYKPSRGGYLHAVDRVPNSNLLLTGGEDGILGIWDTATDKLVDSIDVNEAATGSCTAGATHLAQQTRRTASGSSDGCRWISSCKARDENWWTGAGGNSNAGGFISTWHGPTRSLISTVQTRETPQQLAFCCGSKGITTLLSVANESFVSHWKNPLSLEDPQRVWCNQPSVYAVAVSPDGSRIATGGVGSVVDIFEQLTQCGKQLSTH